MRRGGTIEAMYDISQDSGASDIQHVIDPSEIRLHMGIPCSLKEEDVCP